MKFKIFLCTAIILATMCIESKAGTVTSTLYAQTTYYDNLGPRQKDSSTSYNHVTFDNHYGIYLYANCYIRVFNGYEYVKSSDYKSCAKGDRYKIANTSNVPWKAGTYLKLYVKSSSRTQVDYDKVRWEYY